MRLVPQLEARERKAQSRYHLFLSPAPRAGECRMSRAAMSVRGRNDPRAGRECFGLYKGRQHGTEVSLHLHSAKFHV